MRLAIFVLAILSSGCMRSADRAYVNACEELKEVSIDLLNTCKVIKYERDKCASHGKINANEVDDNDFNFHP